MVPYMSFGDRDVPDSFKNYVSHNLSGNFLFLAPELAEHATITYESPSKVNIIAVDFPFGKSSMTVSFDPGPSGDPAFILDLETHEEYLPGETLYISSSGFLYLVRKSNEYFEKRLKYSLSGGTLKEIRQPFYQVDLQCETSTPLFMYEEPCNKGNVIATLPQGTLVHILVMENTEHGCPSDIVPDNEMRDPVESYLVATPFGLVGWVASSGGYVERPGKPLGCLRFFGD
jgi:hypothetical protein